MCGRFSETAELRDVRLTFDAESELSPSWHPTYNISPGWGPGFEQLFVCAGTNGQRLLKLGRFWFIPNFWKKELKELPTSFNARAEDLAKRAFFRSALVSRRCLIPATGWREFVGQRGKKRPFHFQRQEPLFAFAGLWSSWHSPVGEVVESFAIITTPPNAVAAEIHDRMPLVMPRQCYADWLDPKVSPEETLAEAQRISWGAPLTVFPSDPIGNNPRFEGPEAISAARVLLL